MTAVFKAEDFRDTIIVLLSNNMNSGLGEVRLLLPEWHLFDMELHAGSDRRRINRGVQALFESWVCVGVKGG